MSQHLSGPPSLEGQVALITGGSGVGQVVKLVNNALVFENTVAIAEMMVLGERAGVAPADRSAPI